MIDRAVELALLGCVPMWSNSGGGTPRIRCPRTGRLLVVYNGEWWVFASSGPLVSSEWARMQLHTVPQNMYDKFLEAIRP